MNSTILSDNEFSKLSSFIYSNYGIKMPQAKKVMLQARLQSRLKANNINSFTEYCKYVFSEEGMEAEIPFMIDVVSTNKTDFFRENTHFEFLVNKALPYFLENNIKHINIWSSASSSGEEAYTIAMLMEEWSEKHSGFTYKILGTDISTRILEKAKLAVYPNDRVAIIPHNLKKKYLLKHKDSLIKDVRISKALREKTEFKRLNLMDKNYQNVPKDFHLIFCRNVLIYFDKETQESVINKLCEHLLPNGIFFLGHSESIAGLNVSLKQIQPTIYIKKND